MVKMVETERNISTSNKHAEEAAAMLVHNTSELSFVRSKLEKFQASVVRDVEQRVASMIDEVMQEMRQHELQSHEFGKFMLPQHQINNTWSNRIKATEGSTAEMDETDKAESTGEHETADKLSTKEHRQQTTKRQRRTLPDKVFKIRESYLTALLEVDHMKTIYNIFFVILLMFLLNSVCYDYFVEGRINFGLGTFKTGLAKIHYVLGIWLLEHAFVFTLYLAFKGWASVRYKLQTQRTLQRFWTHCCLITYIGSQLVFAYNASALCLKLNLPFVTASVLLLESTRLLMKMHAFVRTNAARVVVGKLKVDDDPVVPKKYTSPVPVPSFSTYLYFFFAPTFIYRDHYPRTAQIRWKFAAARFMEVVAIAFLYSYIHERHIKPHFANYGIEEMPPSLLIVKLFGMMLPSIIIFLSGFYLILHSWLNFTSELLRFGDRMFYKDWWTAYTYEVYYRNWNVVVHDWLYEYIYKDFYNHIFKQSKVAASLMVFMVSAIVHEQVLGFALQFFFPVIFVFFGVFGVSLVFMTRNAPKSFGNKLLWFSLIFGNGLLVSLYCMEYYARFNCPKTYNNWWDYLTPAILSCYRS